MEHVPQGSAPPPGAQPLYGSPPPAPPPPKQRPSGLPHGPRALAGIAAAVAVVAVLLLGIRGGESGGTSLIAQAAERTGEAVGARFAGTGTGTGGGIDMQMNFTGAYNAQANQSTLRMEVSSPQAPQLAQMMNPFIGVQDGLTMYMHSPLFAASLPGGKSWMKLDLSELVGDDAAAAQATGVDARANLAQLEAVSDDAREVGTERVRGTKTTHYTASLDPESQAEQLREAGSDLAADLIEEQGEPTTVDVWVDREGYIRRTAMIGPFQTVDGTSSTMQMTIEYFDFGAEPVIDVPSESEVFDGTDMALEGVEQMLE